jgi:O-antigen ligase
VQHNVFLALVTETGVVGMGLFVALLAVWTRAAWRLWRNLDAPPWARQLGLLFVAFMGVYLANGMFHDVSLISMINMYLFFLGGVLAAVVADVSRTKSDEHLRLWLPEEEPLCLAP